VLTWLYVPGDRPDRFGKAVGSGADAVILDLEDAVVPARKAYARAAVAEFLASRHPVPVQVRINALNSPDLDLDLAAVAGLPGLAGLRLPKVDSPELVRRLGDELPPGCLLHCTIESALGVERAYDIATAHPAVASIGLGEADLSADLNVTGEAGLAWARGRIVVAARAAGLPPPAMSVYPNVTDLDGLAASCGAGRAQGFLGRAAIHPRQLPIIVAAFRPAAEEVDAARTVLAAVADALQRNRGTAVLPDGRFADRAMVAAAQRTVTLAEQ
jgi:citrate lyase subunit beta/citryl-CoA lyase